MKKIILLCLICLFLVSTVFAADVRDVMEKAKSSSRLYQSIENSYESSKNNLKLTKLSSTGAGITAAVQQSKDYDKLLDSIPSANVTLSLPRLADDLDISLSVNETKIEGLSALAMAGYGDIVSKLNAPDVSGYILLPGVDVSKKFEFVSKEKKNASQVMAELSVELKYQSDVINFENELIASLIELMEDEQSIYTKEKELKRSYDDYYNAIASGQIEKDSVVDLSTQMKLSTDASSLAAIKSSLATKKKNFKSSYGFDFETITSVPESDLSFAEKEEGNSAVRLKYLELEDAQYKFDKALGRVSGLEVGGNLSVPYLITDGDTKNAYAIDANASVSFTSGNLTVGAKAEARYFDKELSSPKVTITGSWGKNQASDINIENLSLTVIKAQSEYDTEKTNYNVSVLSLKAAIESFNASKETFNIKKEYTRKVFESQKQLYSMGYISSRAYQDAYDAVEEDKVNEIILGLKAMQIANEIRAISL